ncbi:Retrotransposon protein, unclassified, putative [Theobroma cacao]|uniref:Retrotransposon protein, unclassified, putative n=1 Tax=Theobroma cacao TaxID=3641 RepID=A0A061EDR9_THECC|nr:Retrotransposon protein, unclassified, putative [Theobroma cacao]
MNEDLCADISLEKVRIALFQMHPTKAPGPDGLPVLCYQRFWPLLSRDVHKFVVDFLEGRLWSTEVNHTHITLIRKVPQPDQGSQFRPISLCNVIYKIASKVLANRLKSILPVIISANQSPFVLGRLILDNGIVAHEVIHYLHNKRVGKVGNFALKLDMSKAYDRVEWIFMEVLINSDLGAKFVPSRGIRQGDPFSPFLFVIITEALSEKVFKRVSNWKSKVLSIVGKEVLIKAVAQAIPIYVMSCFKLPDTLCAEIDSVYARYWWGSNVKDHKIHWKSWKAICTSKHYEGMGFRNTKNFNLAMPTKQGWRLQTQVPTLAYNFLKARYFPNVNFCEALIGSNPSYLWRSLRESQGLIKNGLIWRVGNGTNISVKRDNWIPYETLRKVLVCDASGIELNSDMLCTSMLDWILSYGYSRLIIYM